MQAVILVGGLGTRLRSVVSDVPKPMAPVNGRPFLSHLLTYLEGQGVTDAVLAVGHLRETIIDAFGERHGGIRLRYSIEEEPLGTGGGLRQALRMVDRFPVFALNGDSYFAIDYAAMLAAHTDARARLTIALRSMPDTGRYGRVAVTDGRITNFNAGGQSGPGVINSGIYLFAEDLLSNLGLPETFSFEKDALEPRIGEWKPLAYVSDAYFIDIGVPEDYQRVQRDLA